MITQAVLLAAGNSSRFTPFNHVYAHKSLIDVMGKTILEHTISSLQKVGITDIILVVSNSEPFKKVLENNPEITAKISYTILPEALGMGAALLSAKEYLAGKFFLLSAYHLDILDVAEKMQTFQKDLADVVLLGSHDVEVGPYGYAIVKNEQVVEVIEKPQSIPQDSLHVIGIYILSQAFVKHLQTIPLEHYHFEKALGSFAKDHRVSILPTETKTISLKYPWDLFGIKDYLLQHMHAFISKEAHVSPNALLIGDVCIEKGATVMEGAVIKGPAYIGKGAFVGTNSILRGGVVLEEHGVIGSCIEVKNALIMSHATTHTGLLEDSIVGKFCKIAAGVLTANVRLDRGNIFSVIKDEKVDTKRKAFGIIVGDNTDFGVRVTTMPGIIIGNHCLIGPGTVVMKNVASNTKYYTKFSGVVEEKNL